MYSTYVLLQADSACKNVHELVHDVVPQKRYVLQGTYLFGSFVILKWSVRRPFLLVGLVVVCRPADTFHVELVCASVRIL